MELIFGIAFAFWYMIARTMINLIFDMDIKFVKIGKKTFRTDIVALVISAVLSWLFAVGMIIVFIVRAMLIVSLTPDQNQSVEEMKKREGSK